MNEYKNKNELFKTYDNVHVTSNKISVLKRVSVYIRV